METALIDIFSSQTWKSRELLNIMGGHHCFDYGMKSVDEIEAYFCVESINKAEISHNTLIININKTYAKLNNIYEATRKSWVIGEKTRQNAELVISEYKGIFRRVFKPIRWEPVPDDKGKMRWMFEGIDVSDQYPQYVNKKNGFKKQGQANPVQMIWGNKEKKFISKSNGSTLLQKFSFFKKIIPFILCFFSLIPLRNSHAEQLNDIPQYTIEKHSCLEPHKCSYDVRIQSKLSEDKLLTISYEIFDEVPAVDKVFIMFYLPCMKIDNGAWASAIFDPTVKINIMDFMLTTNKPCIK